MQYRDVDILASATVGDSGTKTVDLDVTEPITELSILLGLTNGASAVVNKIITNIVTKIEIVDGGTVYASLSGPEAAGCFVYDAGKYPPHYYDEKASAGQSVTIPLRFGRYLGDPLRNLDVSRMRNPQLKITWAKDTGHLTNTISLGVRAKILDGVAGASSALLTKAVREFTTAGSGIEETEIPTEYPIRRLYVRPYLEGSTPSYTITHFKMDCDEGKFIPFDMSSWAMCEEVERAFGYAWVRCALIASNNRNAETWLGNTLCAALSCYSYEYFVNAWCGGDAKATIRVMKHDGNAGVSQQLEMLAYGALPHSIFAYPFGLPDDPATWFNAAAYRKLKLKLTQGAASETCTILVQQDRPL